MPRGPTRSAGPGAELAAGPHPESGGGRPGRAPGVRSKPPRPPMPMLIVEILIPPSPPPSPSSATAVRADIRAAGAGRSRARYEREGRVMPARRRMPYFLDCHVSVSVVLSAPRTGTGA